MSVKVSNLDFYYGTIPALKNISFKVEEGEFLGIIGPNGSGKTTLLKVINKFLKPKSGEILIDGVDLTFFKLKDLATVMAYVPQETSLNFDFTAYEVALMGRNPYLGKFDTESEEDYWVVSKIFNLTKCEKIANRNFNDLSGGEKQKIIFSRALVQEPKILLLDEPTTHLDIYNQIEYMELLKKFQKNEGLTIIMVIHDLNLAAQYCDRLILMSEGGIYSEGSVENVLTEDNIKSVFNIDVIMHKSYITDSIHIVPYLRFIKETHPTRIHIICGGGSGAKILHLFKNFKVSVGVLNSADSDHEVASLYNYQIVTEKPFSPISLESYNKLLKVLEEVEYVIFCNFPIGRGNLKNLECILEIDKKIIIYEETDIELRDFTDGKAKKLYEELKKRPNVQIFTEITEIFKFIESENKKIKSESKKEEVEPPSYKV
ncbi:MAG: ABC transporter ATP-binding protein [Promethearchaeota archaeon]